MGTSSSRPNLDDAIKKAETKVGKIGVSGRYHRLPKRIEEDYKIEKKVLGSGYNGSVFAARSKITNHKFAVKGFHLHGISKKKMEELETEAEIFLSMDHPHIVRLVGVYETNQRLNLVMECMEGGELFDRLVQRKKFTEKDAAHAVWQMLLAVNYIHSHGVVHRDLKLENFLYETQGSDHLKLIDFGFSHVWEPNTKMALSCGTLAYIAPEVLSKSYTSKCDLWSLGVIVFILLVGYMPFSGEEMHVRQSIKEGRTNQKPEKWKGVSHAAKAFVKKLLEVDPEKRMSAEEALQHSWISDRDQLGHTSPRVDEPVCEALCQFAKASKFRRACMSVMAWSLTNEERSKVRDAFIELDQNKKGTVTLYELKTVLQDRFHLADPQMQPIFEALDTSNDEEIHYTEFLAAMVSTRIAMHDDLLIKTFKRFDVDNNGDITIADLRKVLGESFDGAEVDQLMQEADLSHDGKISLDEFIYYLKEGAASNDDHQRAAHMIIDSAAKENTIDTWESDDLLAANRPEGFLELKTRAEDVIKSPSAVDG